MQDKQWKAFLITGIFDLIQRGKRLKMADHIPVNKVYISSSIQICCN
ncbi:MAG: hypothetical protein IJ563_13565 [Selenomonadaceae bacterium]|nr:hypothetical protein [Selenomonadaceae bacterium]